MVNIVLINSSFRKDGNTARIIDLIRQEIAELSETEKLAVAFKTIFLAHENIATCRGCRVCFDRGEEFCPLKDDLLLLKEHIDAADCVLLSSPVYVEDVNGVMKNWIDRMAFLCHRPMYFDKVAYIVSTSGAGASRHNLRTMNFALTSWGFRISGEQSFLAGALTEKDELKKTYGKKIRKIAQSILSTATKDVNRVSFVSLLTFRVQQLYHNHNLSKNSLDSAYWEKNGWLDMQQTYYFNVKTNPIKRGLVCLLAAGIFKIMSR